MPLKVEDVRKVALALPESTEEQHHHFGSFRVRGEIFVTIPPGGELLHIFLPDETREHALAMAPEVLEPVLWGSRVLGVRALLPKAKKATVLQLVKQAYGHKSSQVASRKQVSESKHKRAPKSAA